MCADLVLNADKTEQSDDVNGTGSGTGYRYRIRYFASYTMVVSFRGWGVGEGLEVSLSCV